MEAIAKRKNLKGSPQKTRLVIDMIRGRNVSQALAILQFTNKRAAKPVAKLLRSAIANATYKAEQQNIAIDPDDLWVKTCFVDMGMHKNRRRLRPAPQGRAYQEQRHYCHITIEVSSEKPAEPVVKLKKDANTAGPEFVQKDSDKKKKAKAKKASEVKEEKKAKAEKEEAPEKVETPAAEDAETVEAAEAEAVEAKETEAKETEAAEEAKAAEESAEAEAAPAEETVEAAAEEETPADDQPAAAETGEEETGTKPAADAQEDINEDLEKQ
ncbi:MAG: 50S ribosomal protein L22 [Pyrinomonadaceae bacterium]